MKTRKKTQKWLEELLSAIEKKELDAVRTLLQSDTKLHAVSGLGDRQCSDILRVAIKRYDSEIFHLVLAQVIGRQCLSTLACTSRKQPAGILGSPLHVAVSSGNVEAVRLLLEFGANPNIAVGCNLETPLIYCCRTLPSDIRTKDQLDIIQALAASPASDLEIRSRDRSTALSAASTRLLVDVVSILCSVGADPNPDIVCQRGALYQCSVPIIRTFLDTGKVNLQLAVQGLLTSPCIRRPEKLADWSSVLRMLLEAGADVNILGEGGITVTHIVAGYGTPEMIQLLLRHGADIHCHRNYVTTPLMRAASRDNIPMLRCLLKYNCDMYTETISFHTKIKNTALSSALSNNKFGSIRCLIEAGCKVQGDIRTCFLTGSAHRVFCQNKRRQYMDIIPDKDFVEWFCRFSSKPPSLLHCCRLLVREILGRSLHRNLTIDKTLPKCIKDFLYLEDIWL